MSPRADEDLHRRDDRRGQPVRDEDVVAPGIAAEVLERELGQPVAEERRREVVVERRRVGAAEVERALEPA